MNAEDVDLSGWLVTAEPGDDASLQVLCAWAPVPLPIEYLEVLRLSNGGEGSLAISPWWFQLWSSTDIPKHHKGYQTGEYFPEYLGFGSSGGGVMFAFKRGSASSVFGIDFCNADPDDIRLIARDFQTFAASMGKSRRPLYGDSRSRAD